MVKFILVTLLMDTLVNTLMTFLVILVVDLVRIDFANERITVIPQFVKFIGKNFGLTFHIHGSDHVLISLRKNPVTL